MVTPRTGRPKGRPKAVLGEDPDRYLLGLADALHMAHGVSAHQARALAVLELCAKKLGCSGEPSDNMRAAHERLGAYDISGIRGGEKEERALEKVLPKIGAIRKKVTRRYCTETDLNYRTVMASMFLLALFGKGNFVSRAFGVHLLSTRIGEQKMPL
jgi:hypothetical protein